MITITTPQNLTGGQYKNLKFMLPYLYRIYNIANEQNVVQPLLNAVSPEGY
jgi:hypothetical protein